MLALDKQVAKKIGEHYIIAHDKKGKPVFAITSNYLKCKPCILPEKNDQISCCAERTGCNLSENTA